MGNLKEFDNSIDKALPLAISAINKKKFNIRITSEIFRKNGWNIVEMETAENTIVEGWMPNTGNEDFDDVFVWYRGSKEVWCYKYCYGTYIYDIKSLGELEIILAREGFVYSFDI